MAFNPYATDQTIKAGRLTFATVGSNPVEPYLDAIYEPLTLTPAMTIIAGNVGIGTNVPLQGFHVNRQTTISANIGIGTTNPRLPIDIWNTSAIRIPVGTELQRPSVPQTGSVRYNTTTQQFEGYGPGEQWGSLGGVKSVDGATYITAELSPGTNDSNLRFYTANEIRVFIDANGNVGIGTTLPTEKLLVEGNIYSKGTVYASNLKILGATTILDTTTSNTEQLIIRNEGTGPALQVTQTGPQPVAQFVDAESGTALFISGDGNVGVGTVTPKQRLDVQGTSIFTGPVGFGTSFPRTSIDLYGDVNVKYGANIGIGTITNSRFQIVEALYEYPPLEGLASITSNVFTISNAPNGNGSYIVRTSSDAGSSYLGWKAFNKTKGWTNEIWLSSNVSMPAYIDIELPIPIQLKSYSIINGNSGTGDGTSKAPKTWYLQGSTNGTTYHTISTQTNVLWTSENQTQDFKLTGNLFRYKFYRIVIVESYNPIQTHIAEWKLFGYETKNYALYNDIFVGIGTTAPRAELDVEGTALLQNLITSNITILGNSFIGQDNPTLRSRLQISPINALTQVPLEDTSQFQYLTPGLWKYDPSKTQVYLNGTKLAYYSSNLKDFDVSYQSSGTENTLITVTLDVPAKYGDVLDITFWPSYLDDNALMQPGYMVQNINYSQWIPDETTSNIYFDQANVGIGTILPTKKLEIVGDAKVSQSVLTSNLSATTINGQQVSILNMDGGVSALQVTQPSGSTQPVAKIYTNNGANMAFYISGDASANIGIGTSLPTSKLTVTGDISLQQKLQISQVVLSNVGLNLQTELPSDGSVIWSVSSEEKLRLSSSGNLGIGTQTPIEKLHVEGSAYISSNLTVKGIVTTSNLIILGDTLTLNTTTSNTDRLTIQNDGSGPALTVIQTGAEAVARFIDAESGTALFIADTGKIGIGTAQPSTSLDIRATDALRVPVGTEAQKPSGQVGYVRYNTTTQQFEGYGPGDQWGSLGGVKSVDGLTYILAETAPGSGDCNLRFYTSGIQQVLLNPDGNVGIGTTVTPAKLYVKGDATISGTLSASNLNIIDQQFYNNDNAIFQARLQVAPVILQYINTINSTTSNQFTIEGLWKIEPMKTQLFLNGTKMVYASSNEKDYDTTYVHSGTNTVVTVLFDTPLTNGDVVDLTVWPSYLTNDSLREPGFVIQNIAYTVWNSNESDGDIHYVDGNVGIGTTIIPYTLSVHGDIYTSKTLYASNLNILGDATILNTVTSNTERIVVKNDGTGPALQVFQSGSAQVAEFYDENKLAMLISDGGNVGIGTSIPNFRLDVSGMAHVDQLAITRASDQVGNEFKLESISDRLRLGGSEVGLFVDGSSISVEGLSNLLYISKNGVVGIGTNVPKERLHVQDNLYVSGNATVGGTINASSIIASNLAILGDTVVLNTITSNTEQLVITNAGTGPALLVTQTGAQDVARFMDAESGVALLVADTGRIGLGTDIPSTTLDIRATDAMRIPVGTEAQKPTGQAGYIRYNTTMQQYEGYGAGGQWGSLGGVKSVDGLTYILAETSPGASDCNLHFYTAGTEKMFLNSRGNLGIGTIVAPTKLYIEGDATVSGTITASNLNTLYKQFYNNDSTSFQNRLQIAPVNVQFVNTTYGVTSNNFLLDGIWKVEPQKTQVFLNGAKLVYLSSNQKDFNVTYTHQTSNTYVTVIYDTPLEGQDIVDITLWPSYTDNNSLLQPGFNIQNFTYLLSNISTSFSVWACNTLTSDAYYAVGNVGIGTTVPKAKLEVDGNFLVQSNVELRGPLQLYNATSNANNALLVKQTVPAFSIAQFYTPQDIIALHIGSDANLGIGTVQPESKLDVRGTVRAPKYEWSYGLASVVVDGNENFVTKLDSTSNNVQYTWLFGADERMRLQKDGNLGIGTTVVHAKLHVNGDIYTPGTITASNLQILGDTVVLNTVTSNTEQLVVRNTGTGPALHVTQSGNEPIAQFVDAEVGTAMFIANGGYVGIGTTQPEVALAVESTGALRIPAGTVNERPILSRRGQVRYNTSSEQFEGYGSGNQWGPLGGVKSVDGLTYLSAELTPGSSDCNLRFFTKASQRAIINPDGNLGIGTTLPKSRLHVEGDMYVNGIFTVSNVNITGNSFSNTYNNDSVAFRSRLQINPTRYVETVSASYKNTFQLTIQGLYAVYPENVEVYINGTKYVYVSSSLHDYTISTSITETSTLLTVVLDDNIYGGDVIEIIAWPSYINDFMGMQPGFVVQNINLFHTGTQSVLSQPMIQPIQPAPHRFTYDITSNQSVFTETISGLFEFTGSRTEVYISGVRLLYTPTFQDFTVSYTQSFTTTTITLVLAYPATSGDIIEIYYYATPISTSFGSNFGGVIYQDYTYFQKVNGSSCNIVYSYGNLGIGTTYAKNPLHVEGDITFNGFMYDQTGKAIWIPGSMVEWKPCTYPNPALTAPGTGVFNISLRKGQFKYMGNELVYQFRVEGNVNSKPLIQTANYTLSLEYAIDTSYYSSETILGDAWLTVTSGGTKTTYKAYVQTSTSTSTAVSVRYVNGTYDNSLSELNPGTSIVLQGTIVYKTAYFSSEQSIPTTYLPNSFVQNILGYTALNNGGVPSRARLDVIESGGVNSCNLPVMILDQRGSNDNIFEIRSNASEIKLVVNRYGNLGIGTTTPSEKIVVNGTVRATSFVGDGSQLTGLGGYSIWNILNSSNISYCNHVLLGDQATTIKAPKVLNVVDQDMASIRIWSVSTNNSIVPSIELIRGTQATPDTAGNDYWDTYIAPDGTYRIRNRNLGVLTDVTTYGISNVGINGTLTVQSNVWVGSTLYASNIQVLGDFVTMNTVTSNTEQMVIVNEGTGPALHVVQKGVQPLAQFVDAESGASMIIANDGKVGFGTYMPQVTLDIVSTDALHLPTGTQGQRPGIAQKGYIRYNTELDQFEGYGAGNAWGSLGGVKSINGLNYITAESSAGAGDSNLRFYTGGIQRVYVGSNGNVGIGTSIATHTLHVEGDANITGILTTSNINIVGKDFFYNNDSTVFRSRLQLSPYNIQVTAPYNNYTSHAITVDGIWKFEPTKTEIYLNGLKLAYINSNTYDYTVISSNQGLNTDIVVSFESGTVMSGDILDMVLWPSYISDTVTMQPGFMVQYVTYSPWTSNNSTGAIQYSLGNVGIGTSVPSTKLHVQGDILTTGTLTASNINIIGDTTILHTVTSNTERVTIQNNGTGPALLVSQTGAQAIADFYDDNVLAMRIADGANVGIGTVVPNAKLHVESGTIMVRGSNSVGIDGNGTWIGVRDANYSNQHMFLSIESQSSSVSKATIKAGGASQGLQFLVSSDESGSYGNQSYLNAMTILPNGNVGIGTIAPVSRFHVDGTITASNITVLGDYTTLNTVTSNTEQLVIRNDGTGPALVVTQTGARPVATFVDAESGVALHIADTGKIGIGTYSPSVIFDIRSTDALRIPVGTEAEKPTGQTGYVRYNTSTQQFEGYGPGNAWGSLGGVKSVNGLNYITAELTPDGGDCNLRFYTVGQQRAILSSNLFDTSVPIRATSFIGDGSQLTGVVASGIASQWMTIGNTLYLPSASNVGIGTTVANADLHVQGDVMVTGIFTTSNINIVGKTFSYNNDVYLRNRLQVSPYFSRILAPSNNYTSHTVTVDGLWKFEASNTDVYINGTRLAYLSSNSKDYDVTYALGTSNTDVTITFDDGSIMANDVLDITLWPLYISNDFANQPGYSIQSITYVNSNALPFSQTDGYISLNTNLHRGRLDIREDENTSNLPVLVLDQAGPNDILQARSNAITKLVVTKQGYVGIGTTSPDKPLVIQGDINFNGNLYQNGVLFKSSSSTQTFDNNTQTIKYALGGFEVSATGNYYVGTRITWANVTVSELGKIHLSGKCSVAGSDLDNAYRRFETIVSTRNDNATKPRGIVNTETANYYTSAFAAGITHEVNRYSSNAVDLKIKWATNIAVSNYTVNLQLEIVGPSSLGAITCTDIYGTY